MSDRERLETGLRADWTPETLAVYADLLQDLGDPRGELIHLALRIEAGDEAPELRARRDKVLETWLAGVPKSYHHLGETGFVRLPSSYVGVLDTALGEFVRRVEMSGSRTSLLEQIGHLGAAPRPWLETLELVSLTRDKLDPAVAQAAVAAATERAPHLKAIEARGAWIPGWGKAPLVHLTLDLAALDDLARSTDVLPTVTTVVVPLPRANVRGERAALQARSLVAQLPAIERLDLGANETSQEVRDAMFGWLAEAELVRHVKQLVVPAPRRSNNVRQLARVAGRVAGTLQIARAYVKYPFAIPAVETPPPRPWPPLDEVEHRKLSFVVGSKSAHFTPDTLDAWVLVDTLERLANRGKLDDFVPWTAFWNILGNPSWACEMPLATLMTAFESLPAHAEPAISAFTRRMSELPASLRDSAIVRISHAT